MPDSDDLRNTDGGSDIDYADQLSPSDGYFTSSSSSNAVPNIPNVIVPDPTVLNSETKSAEVKAQEAKAESVLNNPGDLQPQALSARDFIISQSSAPSTRSDSTRPTQPTPPSSYAPSSHLASTTRQPLRTHQAAARTPSLYSEAPPAYTPSQTTHVATNTTPLSPATHGTNQTRQNQGYNTFSPNMGVENERLLSRDPESMGEPGDEPVFAPRWSKRFKRRLPPWLNWKIVLVALVLLAVIVGFLTSGYKVIKDDNKKTITPQPSLPGDSTPQQPAVPVEPSEPAQPGSPAKEPLQSTYCPNAKYRFSDQIMAIDYGKGQNFTFVQDAASNGGNVNVRVGGQINVRKLDDGGSPRVVLELVTNDDMLRLDCLIDQDNQAMKITVPKKFHSDQTEDPPCVEMRATIYVPENGELQELLLKAIHLDILTFDDLSLHVSDFSKFTTVIGDVVSGVAKPRTYDVPNISSDNIPDFTYIPAKQSYTFDSRIIEIYTTTGSITGNWPLYDLLGLHVTSGNIKTSITPKPILESAPKPAVLSISSVSGTIHANEPIHERDQIPAREYLVDIKSTSGGIHAAVAFGEGVELKSTASDIAADLLPVLDTDKLSPKRPAQLETVTTSGTTAIRILEPIWYGRNSQTSSLEFNCLESVHKSTSANIGLKYPQSWVGDIQGETTSGRLSVKGKDVRITRANGGWGRSIIEAYKGKSGNGSTVAVKTMLGNLDAIVGDE